MATFRVDQQRKKRGLKFWLKALLAVLLIAAISTIIGVRNWYYSSLNPLSNDENAVVVVIEAGATAQEIGDLLEDNQIIRSASAFDWYTRLNNYRDQLQAGGYSFSPSETVPQIVKRLIDGDIATDLVTILPAQRIDQIKASLIIAGYTRDEVNEAFDARLYVDHPALKYKPETANLEGYLYPESFQRSSNTSLQDIIRASLDETAAVLTPQLRSDLAEQALTVHQAIILASIVEREVSKLEDRPIVAQVFLTRLKRGIMLGSDPTALYGALIAGIDPTVFADTPYNTRIYTGLPPGPINNISAESLEAIAYPADTDYIFFVSGDDGNTYFSRTLQEHEALTAKHCIELCRSY